MSSLFKASSGSLGDVTEGAVVCSEGSLIGSSVFSESAVELASEDSLDEVAEDGSLVFSDSLEIVEDSLGLSDSFGVVEDDLVVVSEASLDLLEVVEDTSGVVSEVSLGFSDSFGVVEGLTVVSETSLVFSD